MDVIILSWAKDAELKRYTENAVETLHNSAVNVHFNPVVLETNHALKPYQFPHCVTLYPKEPFHYNRWMNLGFELGTAPFVAFCNNDLKFTKGWAEKMIDAMYDSKLVSASPWCIHTFGEPEHDTVIRGNITGKTMCGWCIVVKRDWFKNVMFDESCSFFCSDNVYSEQLNKLNIKHGLVTGSIVNHAKIHPTVEKFTDAEKKEFVHSQVKIYNKKYNKNLFGWGNE